MAPETQPVGSTFSTVRNETRILILKQSSHLKAQKPTPEFIFRRNVPPAVSASGNLSGPCQPLRDILGGARRPSKEITGKDGNAPPRVSPGVHTGG